MNEKHPQDTTILVIDDSSTNLEVLSNYFKQYGYTIVAKTSGEKALKALESTTPDLILLDIVMPGIDGFEICRRLKEHDGTKDIPVIFMTALTNTPDKVKGFELGAVDYITKPFQREEVLIRVKTHLTLQALKKSLQVKNQILQVSLERERKMMEDLQVSLSLSLPHELRTPLTVLLGFSSFLTNPATLPAPDKIIQYGNAIYKNSLRLYHLVENSLLYANLKLLKYTSQENALLQHGGVFNVTKMISSVAQQYAKDMKREDDLILELADAYVRISPTNFEKIFTELLDNAFKYSQPGSPVSVKTVISGNLWILSITDRGRGMTKEQIANIGAYIQFDRKHHEQQGLGLGLTIAQLLAQLEGGMFSIKSHLTQGTTTSLALKSEEFEGDLFFEAHWFDTSGVPRPVAETEIHGYAPLSLTQATASPGTGNQPFKVLIIDSTWNNGEILEQLLSPLGFEVFEAFDEFDGVNKIVKYSPDIIFLDNMTCELESVKAMRKVQHPERLLPLKIVAIAQSILDSAQRKQWLTCCDELIEKPLHAQTVFETLQAHLPLQWTY